MIFNLHRDPVILDCMLIPRWGALPPNQKRLLTDYVSLNRYWNIVLIGHTDCLAQLLVYSMMFDDPGESGMQVDHSTDCSRALQDLGRIITSTESYFHPSNSGPWTLSVSPFSFWKY